MWSNPLPLLHVVSSLHTDHALLVIQLVVAKFTDSYMVAGKVSGTKVGSDVIPGLDCIVVMWYQDKSESCRKE